MSSPPTFEAVANTYLDTLHAANGSRAPPPVEHTVLLLMSRLGDVAAFTGRSLAEGVALSDFELDEVRELIGQLAVATTGLGVACNVDVGRAALAALGQPCRPAPSRPGHGTPLDSCAAPVGTPLGTPPRHPAAAAAAAGPGPASHFDAAGSGSPPGLAAGGGPGGGPGGSPTCPGLLSPTSTPSLPLPPAALVPANGNGAVTHAAAAAAAAAGSNGTVQVLSPGTISDFWPQVDRLREECARCPARFTEAGVRWCVVRQDGQVEDMVPDGRNIAVAPDRMDEYFAALQRLRPQLPSAFELGSPMVAGGRTADGGAAAAAAPPQFTMSVTPYGDDTTCLAECTAKWARDVKFLRSHHPTDEEVGDLGLTMRMPLNGKWHPLVQDGAMVPVTHLNLNSFLDLLDIEEKVASGQIKRSASMRRLYLPDGVRQVERFDANRDDQHLLAPGTNHQQRVFHVDFDPDRVEDVMPAVMRRTEIPPFFQSKEHYVTFLVEHPEQFPEIFLQVLRHSRLVDSWQVTYCVPNDKCDPPTTLSTLGAHARCGVEDLKPDGRSIRVSPDDVHVFARLVFDAAKHLPAWAAP